MTSNTGRIGYEAKGGRAPLGRLLAISIGFVLALSVVTGLPFPLAPQVTFVNSAYAVEGVVNVSDTADTTSINPRIAIDSDNNILVVWQEGSPADILFSKSTDGGASFDAPVNVSNSSDTDSINPKVASAGGNIFALWEDSSDVFISTSTDGGDSFASATNLSDNEGSSSNPQMAASADGSRVSVVWQDETSGKSVILFKQSSDGGAFGDQILLSGDNVAASIPQIASSDVGDVIISVWRDVSTNDVYLAKSADGGGNFTSATNLSDSDGASNNPEVAVSGDGSKVFLVWDDFSPGNNEILFTSSSNGGDTFGDVLNLSNTPSGISDSPQVAISGDASTVFVVWEDNALGNFDIYAAKSADAGSSFTGGINVSDDEDTSFLPRLAVSSDSNLFIVWHTTTGTRDVYNVGNLDFGQTIITIDSIDNSEPTWGLDAVTVSGDTVNNADGYTVTVDWGDGSSSSEIPISDDGAWRATHDSYNSTAVGTNQIVATMVDAESSVKATSQPADITVKKHITSLQLDQILSVRQGDDFRATGSLVDSDSNGSALEHKTVSFDDGAGNAVNLTSATTRADGTFSKSGSSQDEASAGWIVQAHFAGDASYEASDSNKRSFDTVATDAQEYPVEAGQNAFVNLTDFDASVTFEEATNSGNVFVSECSPPDSSRYQALDDRCLRISSAVPIAGNTSAKVTISFAQATEESSDSIDVFHVDPLLDTIVDITQSRNSTDETVTGTTTEFSDFVLGIALHEAKPDRAIRQQLFVGNNEVSLRDISNPANVSSTISLDKSTYKTGDSPVLTISDADANINLTAADIITARVTSETSSPDFITITLTETGSDSGIFEGTFTLTTGSSSGTNLKAKTGDDISVSYIPHNARITVSFEGVSESGVVDIGDYLADDEPVPFQPISSAVDIQLVDAQLGPNGKVRVTISYANDFIDDQDPAFFRIYHKELTGDWSDITLEDPEGHHLEAQTVTGETNSTSPFVIGIDVGEPGGAGGGFGQGLIVDAVASIARSTSSSGGDGGGSGGTNTNTNTNTGTSIGTFIAQLAAGLSVKLVAVVAPLSTVNLQFENVLTPGNVAIEQKSLASMASMFSEVTQSNGKIVYPNGQIFTTVGSIFDIKPSTAVTYQGTIDVTVPYDKNALAGLTGSDVRLLHFNGNEWEDATISIDENSGTVTGEVASLSPVVAAVVNDGTFGATYFEENPMMRIADINDATGLVSDGGNSQVTLLGQDGSRITTNSASAGSTISVVNSIKNLQRTSQSFTYYLEVFDSEGVVIELQKVQGALDQGQTTKITSDWTAPEQRGEYTFKLFVIGDSSENIPFLLKNAISATLEVT